MSKPIQEEQHEYEEEILDELGIEDGDYGFIVGPNGELKHLFTPEGFAIYPPKTVQRILKIFGIKDINAVGFDDSDTIH